MESALGEPRHEQGEEKCRLAPDGQTKQWKMPSKSVPAIPKQRFPGSVGLAFQQRAWHHAIYTPLLHLFPAHRDQRTHYGQRSRPSDQRVSMLPAVFYVENSDPANLAQEWEQLEAALKEEEDHAYEVFRRLPPISVFGFVRHNSIQYIDKGRGQSSGICPPLP
ncbi:MAG: hypothetical protein ACOCYB_09965 [Alkalispirochaeta sp.]